MLPKLSRALDNGPVRVERGAVECVGEDLWAASAGDVDGDGCGVGQPAVGGGVGERVLPGEARIGGVGEGAVAIVDQGAVGRLAEAVEADRVAIGIGVVGQKIRGDIDAEIGVELAGERIVDRVGRQGTAAPGRVTSTVTVAVSVSAPSVAV